MNIQNCTPLEARDVFRMRPWKNGIRGVIVFVAIFSLAFFHINFWIMGAVALVAALATFLYLESRVIVIFIECPSCRKPIDTTTRWECGFKQCWNENTGAFPFIHECEHCHFVPKAYLCHHCLKPIFLTPDRQALHAAKCLAEPIKPKMVVKDVMGEKVAGQNEEVRDLEHQLKKTTLEKQIEIEKNKPLKSATEEQALEDEITEEVDRGETLDAIEERLKTKADAKYPNDEHKRQKAHARIEQAILNRIE